jgi:hypothetical protein
MFLEIVMNRDNLKRNLLLLKKKIIFEKAQFDV